MTVKPARRNKQVSPAPPEARVEDATLDSGYVALLEASHLLAVALETVQLGATPKTPIFERTHFDGTPIGVLTQRLNLRPFERDALVLLAGVNLSSELANALQKSGVDQLHFGLILALLSDDPELDQRRIAADAPLRRLRLVQFADTGSQVQPINLRPLNLDEWVFMALLGHVHLDEVLARVAQPLARPAISFTDTQQIGRAHV